MPPFLLGAALAFWGWQTGWLPVGLAMGAVLELRGRIRSRWDLTRADFHRVSDLSAVLLVFVAIYQVLGQDSARAITGIIQWLPMLLFPLVAAQLYSTAGRMDVAVFFWSLRRKTAGQPEGATPTVDLTPAYFALCVLSASTANARTTFYAGLVGLSAWALWHARAPRAHPLRWATAIVVAVALGWGGHVALAEAQRALERRAQALFLSWIRRDVDPSRTTTALGEIGELKLSDRIVLRVEPSPDVRPPRLLRQAAYNVYHPPAWLAVDAAFASVPAEADGATWILKSGPAAPASLTVSTSLPRGRGMLAVPGGAARLEELLVVSLAQNRFGAVRVDEGLALVTYTARFPAGGAADGPPTPADLAIPAVEARAIARAADEAGLSGRPPAEAVRRVQAYFLGRFGYSRYLRGSRPDRTALEEFLLTTRRGHCEYFATAAVLMLRQAGVPARYAVGYAAHEWSRLERRWVVRASDAHAWALAWVDGSWVDVDTTPPVWVREERADASTWSSVGDAWAWVSFLFTRWRWSERQDRLTANLGWLLIPLVALLGWRLWARRRVAGGAATAPGGPRPPARGDDSDFYRVERRLSELGFPRPPGDALGRWLSAVATAAPPALASERLRPLLDLHYRYRFDPAGLAAAERDRLRRDAQVWLDDHPAAAAPASPSAAAP